MNSNSYVVRPMRKKDVSDVVLIHQKGFPGFFLSFLGQDFLFLLYQSFVDADEGVTLVYESDGLIQGFVAGVTNQKDFYSKLLKRRKWAFAVSSIIPIVKKPSIILRLLRALRKPQSADRSASAACLMSIAVSPEASGRGIGKLLVESFYNELKKRGVSSFCLTTDRDNNDSVNNFYEKLGFTRCNTFKTPEGRWMNEYLFTINENR